MNEWTFKYLKTAENEAIVKTYQIEQNTTMKGGEK
jgi:hypothetical protein